MIIAKYSKPGADSGYDLKGAAGTVEPFVLEDREAWTSSNAETWTYRATVK